MSGRKALGRGLAAIIPVGEPDVPEQGSESGPRTIAIKQIVPNPTQPRRHFDETQLAELASSLREHGVLEPVIVRPQNDKFELVVGERRWRAAQLAGLSSMPAIVRSLDDRQVMELALVENLQREDLNPMEEAEAFQRLADEFRLTQEQIAERVGKQRSTVANRLRLLELEPELQRQVRDGKISAGHAKALLAVTDGEKRQALANRCIAENLSVRQIEEAARQTNQPEKPKKSRKRGTGSQEALPELVDELQQALGTKVRIVRNGQGGRIEIEFYDEEDITRIYELIVAP